jgi:sugar phosphate isomerase/epimerase
MKLGFLTAPFPTTPLNEVADWGAAQGFTTLEVCCWPAGEGAARRYAGICHIDVDGLSDARAKEIVGDLDERGVEISALAYYPNPLHHDADQRQVAIEHLKKVVIAAPMLGVGVVTTFIGGDKSRSQQENWEAARDVWPDIVELADDSGVRIAIENCPMIFSQDEWPSGNNLAYSPSIWRTMFEEFGETVGLNFDPSHLVWQMIDMEAAIEEFGQRFYHVHAKDLQVDPMGLYEHGVMSLGMGWQIPRLPGLGEVDWPAFFSGLYRVGYDYVVSIEHEDRDFEGDDDLIKRGFLIARDVLSPYVK